MSMKSNDEMTMRRAERTAKRFAAALMLPPEELFHESRFIVNFYAPPVMVMSMRSRSISAVTSLKTSKFRFEQCQFAWANGRCKSTTESRRQWGRDLKHCFDEVS